MEIKGQLEMLITTYKPYGGGFIPVDLLSAALNKINKLESENWILQYLNKGEDYER